jgi:hypothetical protein
VKGERGGQKTTTKKKKKKGAILEDECKWNEK